MPATYDRNHGFTLRRHFDAPPEALFEAWTDPAQLGWFFNPGFEPDGPPQVDLRVGGEWRQHMIVNAGHQYYTGGIYREIVPGRRLSFYWGAIGGWPELDPDNLDDAPLVTIDFVGRGSGAEMVFNLALPDQLGDERIREWMEMGISAGWSMTIDRLNSRYALI